MSQSFSGNSSLLSPAARQYTLARCRRQCARPILAADYFKTKTGSRRFLLQPRLGSRRSDPLRPFEASIFQILFLAPASQL
jgi:hypothetical protein